MIEVEIDSSRLNKGIQTAMTYSKRTLPQVLNSSAYYVAKAAQQNMPFVMAETVDKELGTIYNAVIGKRGNVLKNKKNLTAAKMGKGGAVPLAVLIVVARAKPESKYNQLTNSRYALPSNPWKGISRTAGRWLMMSLINKMLKLRHKSGSFLKAGWASSLKKMRAAVQGKFLEGMGAFLPGNFYEGDRLGDAIPAKDGLTCFAKIENGVGMEGINAANFNRALWLYGAPGLQSAIDQEGDEKARRNLKHFAEGLAEETNKEWN